MKVYLKSVRTLEDGSISAMLKVADKDGGEAFRLLKKDLELREIQEESDTPNKLTILTEILRGINTLQDKINQWDKENKI